MTPLVDRLPFALLGAVPALVVMLLVDRLAEARDEPRWLLRHATVCGALVIVPVLVVELALVLAGVPLRGHDAGTVACAAFVGAALPEELGKAACLLWLLHRRVEFHRRGDGIVYGARVGLGFALVETVAWSLTTTNPRQLLLLLLARACLSVPCHALWSAMMGYAVARRRIDGARGLGLAAAGAIAAHGSFDFGLGLAQLADQSADAPAFVRGAAVALLAAVASLVAVHALLQRARTRDRIDAANE
ncbi:MAG: PrsW family intramembrane metalloprotease [Nannocystaceae bacterium]|nr:PrsW family intramembrane metalloprotease [Nannocystaceae bacterium]